MVLLSLHSLAGAAAWPPPSVGRAAFLPLLWVPENSKNTGPKGAGGGGGGRTTTQRRKEKEGSTTHRKSATQKKGRQ